MKLIYSTRGNPIADSLMESVILEHYKEDKDLIYSNELVFYAARVLALRGTIDRNKLEFYYEDNDLGKLDELFGLSTYPFIGIDVYLDELLGL